MATNVWEPLGSKMLMQAFVRYWLFTYNLSPLSFPLRFLVYSSLCRLNYRLHWLPTVAMHIQTSTIEEKRRRLTLSSSRLTGYAIEIRRCKNIILIRTKHFHVILYYVELYW